MDSIGFSLIITLSFAIILIVLVAGLLQSDYKAKIALIIVSALMPSIYIIVGAIGEAKTKDKQKKEDFNFVKLLGIGIYGSMLFVALIIEGNRSRF